MADKIIQFTPGYFIEGEMYSVTGNYESGFIGTCEKVEDDVVTFSTPYGDLTITASMVINDDYRFQKVSLANAGTTVARRVTRRKENRDESKH